MSEKFSLISVMRHLAKPDSATWEEEAKGSLQYHTPVYGKETPHQSISIPWTAFAQTTSSASEVVRQDVGENVLPLVESSLLLSRATIRPDLTGDLQIPVFAPGSAEFQSVAEGADVTAVDFNVAGPKLTPKTGIVRAAVTELALIQSGGQLEQGMRDMFNKAAVNVMQDAIIAGSGTNEPTGILNTTGPAVFNVDDVAATMTYPNFTQLVASTQVSGKIAVDTSVNNGVWIVSPHLMADMKVVQKVEGGEMMMERKDGERMFTLDGYPVLPSNGVPNKVITADPVVANDDQVYALFLDAKELWVGFWGGVRMSVDFYTNPLTPIFSFYFYYDAVLAHPNSVSVLNFRGK